jgi:hypothetical protein
MKSDKLYVQYGCGQCAPEEWMNFDVSPTLRIQKTPVLGWLLKKSLGQVFDKNVRYGDITEGLPGIADNSADGVYCSHVLEHMSLGDFRKAVANSYKMLKPGAKFRFIMPDLKCWLMIILPIKKKATQRQPSALLNGLLWGRRKDQEA